MKHEVICGDALETLRSLPDASFDAVICDPPYATTQCKWDKPLDWASIWPDLWRLCKSPTSPVVLFSAQPFTTDLICSQRQFFRYDWVWDKRSPSGFLNCTSRPMAQHESICVFSRAIETYNPQFRANVGVPFSKSIQRKSDVYGDAGESRRQGVGYPLSILQFAKPNNLSGGGLHPNQKPLNLLEYLVRTYSNEGDTVLDFTAGSGTTLAAAARCGRSAVGIESNSDCCEIARQRLEVATGQFAPRDFGGLFAPHFELSELDEGEVLPE